MIATSIKKANVLIVKKGNITKDMEIEVKFNHLIAFEGKEIMK